MDVTTHSNSVVYGIPPGFGRRLREERKRLRRTQAQMAEAGGVGRLAQLQYEKETTSPSVEYLSKVASVGVDLAYVVVGVRLGQRELTREQEDRIERRAFELVERFAVKVAHGQAGAESRWMLYRVFRDYLVQVELGKSPVDFDPARLTEGLC